MTRGLYDAWLVIYPGEGVYLRVGGTGRRFRTVEELDKTVRGLELITKSKETLTAFTMPHTFIQISGEGRVYITIYGETSNDFSRKNAIELLDELKHIQTIASTPAGKELLGFEVTP